MNPLVTVVTATWKRPDRLLGRCIPSVTAQTYRPLEHLVVIDGPDPDLASRLFRRGYSTDTLPEHDLQLRMVQLGRNHGGVGHAAHAAGAWLAAGEWVCYLDDDNEYLPGHVEAMAAEATRTGADLVCTAWRTPGGDAGGWAPPGVNHTDASSVLHRRELLGVSAWQPGDGYAADGALVERWVAAGVRWSFLPEPTMVYHPADPGAYRSWLRAMASRVP